MNQFHYKLAQVVCSKSTWNGQLWGSRGQRSHQAKMGQACEYKIS